jgi:hypothetical protein
MMRVMARHRAVHPHGTARKHPEPDDLPTAASKGRAAVGRAESIRRWDWIALLLHYVINPARWLTTNNRLMWRHAVDGADGQDPGQGIDPDMTSGLAGRSIWPAEAEDVTALWALFRWWLSAWRALPADAWHVGSGAPGDASGCGAFSVYR